VLQFYGIPQEMRSVLDNFNIGLIIVFTVECGLKLVAYGPKVFALQRILA
jgi:hypothetical protein